MRVKGSGKTALKELYVLCHQHSHLDLIEKLCLCLFIFYSVPDGKAFSSSSELGRVGVIIS